MMSASLLLSVAVPMSSLGSRTITHCTAKFPIHVLVTCSLMECYVNAVDTEYEASWLRGDVTRQGVALCDLQSLVDSQ
jgi:hypothetical protein